MMRIVQRPDYWFPGCGYPLPALTASTIHTGTGKIGGGGRVNTQKQPVRWETIAEWQARQSSA